MEAAYWINVGTFDEFISKPLHWRMAVRKKLRDMTRALRQGGTLTGHPRTDKKLV